MKRFKLIFQIFYVLIALSVLYFSIDVLINTEQYLSKIKLSSYIRFPKYVMIAFLIVSIMMIVSFVLERFNVYKIKEGIEDMEEEIIHLKAKLYDQSESDEGDDDEEQDDDGDDSDDDDED
jgi:cell division protein FtsL